MSKARIVNPMEEPTVIENQDFQDSNLQLYQSQQPNINQHRSKDGYYLCLNEEIEAKQLNFQQKDKNSLGIISEKTFEHE